MVKRRKFNRWEKIGLYLLSGGYCQICGAPLEAGWHADHKTPFSNGGNTDIVNGQALCPKCNRQKGATDGEVGA